MRLDELHILAQEELFEARLALGAHAALVGDLEALVTRYPLRERFWHQLIVALYRSGRAAEALRRAETLRVVLREELGLDPSPSLRELEARVLNDDPTLLQPPVAARRSVTRQLPAEPTRLVGRAEELGLLAGRLRTRSVGHSDRTRVESARRGSPCELAGELWDEFDGEVFVTELAPVRDPTSTVAAIATALDVQQRQHLSIEETLVEYLRAETGTAGARQLRASSRHHRVTLRAPSQLVPGRDHLGDQSRSTRTSGRARVARSTTCDSRRRLRSGGSG